MLARVPAVVPRFLVIVVGCLLASAAVTFAADTTTTPPQPAAAPVPAAPTELVVPDVTKQAYVFAKGTLEDAGLAWKVVGPVAGYAANVVVSQSPAAGTRLVDTGAPLVTLKLAANSSYAQQGAPENASPYPGTRLELAQIAAEPAAATPAPKPAAPKPAAPKPAAPKPAAPKPAAKPAARPPAFAITGAPKEPLDEISLDTRARELAKWLEAHQKPTDANVKHWLYQHQWIVTGARFGWWHGEEALEILLDVDRRVERLWGVGTRSRGVAEHALAEVRERSR